jgi:hypothetical protein
MFPNGICLSCLLADEYYAAQARGEVAKPGEAGRNRSSQQEYLTTVAAIRDLVPGENKVTTTLPTSASLTSRFIKSPHGRNADRASLQRQFGGNTTYLCPMLKSPSVLCIPSPANKVPDSEN